MIISGIDGLSQGGVEFGVMLRRDLRQCLLMETVSLSIAEKNMEPWVRWWMGEDYSPPLILEGWFLARHKAGIHIFPPPATALNALEQLSDSH